ncbi:ABC transporter ATP-binding protein [Demequina sp.]|uniref:ABC transporter ATP-binding protein n=1 Tax=Demequina sp. TaxID=2050685 RepID=UPI003A85FC03
MNAIHVRGLTKAFAGHQVLDGITLDAMPGKVTALLGSNGAGKTTTIGILTTVIRADAGSAVVAGHDVHSDPRAVRRSIAVTGQSASVDGLLTGHENLELVGRLQGLRRRQARERARELISASGLDEAGSRQVSTYSGGMRRRLDLALSLVRPAPVLFLDEPTTGLDPRARMALWDQVRDIAAQGTTVFLTTQYLEEADTLADTVFVLHGGRVVAAGTPTELKRRIGAAEVEVLSPDGRTLDSEPTDGTPAGVRAALDSLEARGAVREDSRIAVRQPTLDEAFLSLTEEVAS